MNPLVSVVMPTYNSELYVEEAAFSILNQSFENFEFLVINEFGSNDRTVDILQSLDDARIRIIQNETKLGIANSLNLGIQEARGKYIARMDSDDISVYNRLEKQVAFLEENSDIGLCGSWQRTFGNSNLCGINGEDNWIHKAPTTHEDIKAGLLFGCCMCHSTIMFRRDAFVKNSLEYNAEYKIEDYELWIRAIKYVNFSNFREVLGYYRISDVNRSHGVMEVIEGEHQQFFSKMLIELGIDFKDDDFLVCDWTPSRHSDKKYWRSRLIALKALFSRIIFQNDLHCIYNKVSLQNMALRRLMNNFDISDRFLDAEGTLPFESIIDEILTYAKQKTGKHDVCIFGLGRIGLRALPHYKKHFGKQLICVSDNDPKKWGKQYEGLKCIPPDALNRNICTIVTVGYDSLAEIEASLLSKKFMLVVPFVSAEFFIA